MTLDFIKQCIDNGLKVYNGNKNYEVMRLNRYNICHQNLVVQLHIYSPPCQMFRTIPYNY